MNTVIITLLAAALAAFAGYYAGARRSTAYKDDADEVRRQLTGKNAEAQMLQQQMKEMQQRHDQEMDKAEERHRREHSEQLEKLREQITSLTSETLKTRSSELFSDNRRQMGEIVTPLKLLIDEVRQSVDNSRASYDKNTAALEEQLKHMCETAVGVGAKADRLSEALQSGPKVQGSFGEMKLEVLLSDFGFTRGIEYDLQQTMCDENGSPLKNDDSGRRMIPDAILHYPDSRDVILDAKVSLSAFVDYVSASDDEARRLALDRHLLSIKKHVEELSAKEYYKYVPRAHAYLDYVIMFVPNESALVLALSSDPSLWRSAFDRKVFITGEQNLFAVLQLLKIAWTQKLQSENHEAVYDLANTLVERLGDFMKRYELLGTNIRKLSEFYDSVTTKVTGRQGIEGTAERLVEMGAKDSSRHSFRKTGDELPE